MIGKNDIKAATMSLLGKRTMFRRKDLSSRMNDMSAQEIVLLREAEIESQKKQKLKRELAEAKEEI